MIRFRSLATWTSVMALTFLSACDGDNHPSQSPTPPPGATNSPPTANAGPDRIVAPGVTVSLDGSGSSDANGTIATYAWTQSSGAPVTLSAANTPTAGFTAPSASGALVFQLTVTDNGGASRSDTVTVTVNASPTSQAGADQTVQAGAAVSLSGSGTDADGTIAGFAWRQTMGQSVTLSAANTGTATFTAPAVAASLAFELTVTDNLGATHTDTVFITVNAASAPRIVRQPIGPRTVHHGSALFFVVASGEDLTYEWHGPFGVVKTSPEPFLMRTGLDPADDGRCYYVVISNAGGSVTSEEACVTVGDIGDSVLDPFDDNLGDDEAAASSYANTLLWLAERVSGGFNGPSFAALTGTSGIHSGVPRSVESAESCLESGSFDGSTLDDSVVAAAALLPTGRHTVTFAWRDCRATSDDLHAENGGLRIDYDFPVRFGEGSVTYYFSGYHDGQGAGPLNGIVRVTSVVQGSTGNGLQDNFEIELGDDLSHGADVVRLDPHISVERRYNDTGSIANQAAVAFSVSMQTYDAGGSAGTIYERSGSAASFVLRFDDGGGGDGETSPFTSLGVMDVGLDSVQTFHLADLELTHDSTWRFTVIPQEECPADVCVDPP